MANDRMPTVDEMRARIHAMTQGGAVHADELTQVLGNLRERAGSILQQKQSGQAREALISKDTPSPEPSTGTPLSPRSVAHLSEYGYSGLNTYEEAKAHLETVAKGFGLPVAATKRTTSPGTVTNEAELVRSKLDHRQGRTLTGPEAELLDITHNLHTGIKSLMTSAPNPKGPTPLIDIRSGRKPETALTTQQIESQSLGVTPEMTSERQRTEPVAPPQQSAPPRRGSGKPRARDISYLPPAKSKKELRQRTAMINADAEAIKLRKRQAFTEAVDRVKASHQQLIDLSGPGGMADAVYRAMDPRKKKD